MAKPINKDLPKLAQRALDSIRDNNLLPDKKPLLVAVSGGPDSVCMLHILWQLRNELKLNLHVAHLDHQLRGEESEADARYATELARRLDIPITIETRSVLSYRTKYRLSLEEAAREVRYTFFSELAQAIGANCVAVGHTQDDHIETILMHLIRGSGTEGLRGLQPLTQWRLGDNRISVVRPLLTVTRAETVAYCQNYELAPRTDSTNLSMSPLRNKIRLQLLPLLTEYNPSIAEALQRTARIAADEMDFIERLGDIAWAKKAKIKNNTVLIDKEGLIREHPAAQRYLLRRAVQQITGNLKDIEAHHIEDIIAALRKPAGKIIQLPYRLVFTVEYDRFLLGYDPAALSPFPPLHGEFTLKVPGKTQAGDWMVKTEIVRCAEMKKENELTAYFDFDKLGNKLSVRTYRPGERFQPLGMNEPKKLSDFMIDARIPHAWRSRLPITYSPKQIVWIVGYRIDERVKVTTETKRVLMVGFHRVRSVR